jgi:hypothetical protein
MNVFFISLDTEYANAVIFKENIGAHTVKEIEERKEVFSNLVRKMEERDKKIGYASTTLEETMIFLDELMAEYRSGTNSSKFNSD